MDMQQAPCNWPISFISCDDGECDALESLEQSEREMIEGFATGLLWEWTGRQFGVCEITVRPVVAARCLHFSRPSTFAGSGPYVRTSDGVGGARTSRYLAEAMYCSDCGSQRPSFRLSGQLKRIISIRVDGQLLDASAYALHDGRVWRVDGGAWPIEQDVLASADELGTLEVTYLSGIPVPAGGQLAAGRLACELAKAFCNDDHCALPERLQTITRQGVTVGFMDQFEDLREGRTGIWAVDAWVSSVQERQVPRTGLASPDYRSNASRLHSTTPAVPRMPW